MARKLIGIRGGIIIALAFFAAATVLLVARAKTIGSTANNTVQWDEQASKELMEALHHSHEVANAGDIKALKQAYIGDNDLVTFELGADDTPVALRSKKEIDAHLDRVSAGINAEECTVRLKKTDGTEQVDHFFGSGTAVKIGDEWKWVQWHMSVGAPRESH